MSRLFQNRLLLAAFMVVVFVATSSVVGQDGPKLMAALFVKGKVALKWQATPGATEYKILRAEGTGEFAVIGTTDNTQHFDTEVIGGANYTYKIAAVVDGAEIAGTTKKISIPTVQAGEFKPPVWSGARIDRESIMLRWDKMAGAMAFNIYRSTTAGANYVNIGSATSTRYADEAGLEKGVTYYYVLTAMDENMDETAYSEEQSIKFGMSQDEIDLIEHGPKIELVDIPMTLLWTINKAGDDGDMNQPAGVCVDSKDNVYVTDALNFRVCVFDANGQYKFSFGERTPTGSEKNPPEGSFMAPFTVVVDQQDQVWVSDIQNSDIQIFTPEGKFIKRITVNTPSELKPFKPSCFAILDDGRIVTTDGDNHRLLMIDQDGKILKEIGGHGGDPGQFNYPDGVTVTKDGIICVVDILNCRIQQFDLEFNFIREFGEAGNTAGTFGRPKYIAHDDANQLWVSDAMGHLVQVLTLEGEPKSVLRTFEAEGLELASPRGICIKNGRLFIVNRLPHTVFAFKFD